MTEDLDKHPLKPHIDPLGAVTREHVLDGHRCWCDPYILTVEAR